MPRESTCELAGHEWAPMGGGLYMCIRFGCDAEKWDEEELEDFLDDNYADWGGANG